MSVEDAKRDVKEIVRLYNEERWTLRMIAEKYNIDHHTIKRILVKEGITITRRNTQKEFTDEHRRKISVSRLRLKESGYTHYNKGLKTATRTCKNGKTGKELLYSNMSSHLRHNIEIDWLMKFLDIEKLKFLNHSISRRRDFGDYSQEFYKLFIETFYNNKQFNAVYELWREDTSNNLLRPSPDHINPDKSKRDDVTNIRFITWFENRCKNNMSLEQWEHVKKNIDKYFV